MSEKKPTFKHRLEYAALYLVYLMGRTLPRRQFVRVGEGLGRFVFDVLRIRREVALANLRFVFGEEMSEEEIVDLARRSYAQLGGTLLEFASISRMTQQDLVDEVEIEGIEILEEALKKSGKGAMLVTGHYGNWELFGAAFVARGYPTTFLVKEQSNPLASKLHNHLREIGGIEIVGQGPLVARGVLRALRRGHMVGVLPDQDARRHGVFVDFLGRPASTFKGPAYFAWREGVPIVQGYSRRLPDGRHVATAERAIWPDTSAPEEEEVQRMTQLFTNDLEKWVRAFPENYYWVHRRWKTQPLDAEAFEGPDPDRSAQ